MYIGNIEEILYKGAGVQLYNPHEPLKGIWPLNHDLLIAKLEAHGLDALRYMKNYVINTKERVRLNKTFSEWERITAGILQGSILGPLLLNISL